MHLAMWGQSCFLYCPHTNSLLNIRDGECGGWLPLTAPHPHPPSFSVFTWEELSWWLQIAGFVSPGLRNLYLEKVRLLVECRAENILSHKANPQSSNNCLGSFETCHSHTKNQEQNSDEEPVLELIELNGLRLPSEAQGTERCGLWLQAKWQCRPPDPGGPLRSFH